MIEKEEVKEQFKALVEAAFEKAKKDIDWAERIPALL
jgi:hypothetical protein